MAGRRGADKASGLGLRRLRRPVSVLACLLLGTPLAAKAQVPPDASWRTFDTPHFRVTFSEPLEPLARRAGALAEAARARLADRLVPAPSGRVELLLTDHIDASNGFARIAPYPRITVYARPPVDGFTLSWFHDWLDLVVTHELAHAHHLDVTGTPGRVLRSVFGRVPATWPIFPELATPRWVVEGLATWYESELTGGGRVHGSAFPMMLRMDALDGGVETLDRASGESPAWPAGQRPYLYGSLFFEWLLERHGPEAMERFVRAVGSQWVPYRLNAAARDAFGTSFSAAWREWSAEVRRDAEGLADAVRSRESPVVMEPLTSGARQAFHAAVGPDGTLVYARSDGRDDPGLRFVRPDGSERHVRTNGMPTLAWAPDGSVVFSQFELADSYRAYRDLYRAWPDGSVERLTSGARLEHPSVTPDGHTAWAVRSEAGLTRLVRVRLSDGWHAAVATPDSTDVWGFPAVSPDGRWVAAVRWRRGEGPDLVVLAADDGRVHTRITHDRALELAPAWAADGTLVWSSDRTGVTNLYAAAIDTLGRAGPVRQMTDVVSGVAFASVAGGTVYASLYGADGWDLVRFPWEPGTWTGPGAAAALAEPAQASAGAENGTDGVQPADTATVRPYRAWPTLRPRYWEPVVLPAVEARDREVLGFFVGGATALEDLVERHRLELQAAVSTRGGALDAHVGYLFRGLGSPLIGVSLDQRWDAAGPLLGRREPDATPDTLYLEERERSAFVDLTFLNDRWRRATALTVGAGLVEEDRRLLDTRLRPDTVFRLSRPTARLGDVRLTVSVGTARAHELSTGPEEGVSAFVRLRTRAELDLPDSLAGEPGRDRGLDEILGRVRAYRSFGGPGFSDHVLAVQVAAGAARGPGADAFHFDVGGASGRPEPVTGFDLLGGRSFFFPVRGYADGDRSGRYAWAASAEWRFPLALVHRGIGAWPLHLDRVHGALFGDAGNAWGPELGIPGYQRPRERTLMSVGAELRLDALTLFTVPVTLRLGAAAPLVDGRGASVYLRFGPAF